MNRLGLSPYYTGLMQPASSSPSATLGLTLATDESARLGVGVAHTALSSLYQAKLHVSADWHDSESYTSPQSTIANLVVLDSRAEAAPAVGMGVGVMFRAGLRSSTSDNLPEIGRLAFDYSATGAPPTSRCWIALRNAGDLATAAAAAPLELNGTGRLTLRASDAGTSDEIDQLTLRRTGGNALAGYANNIAFELANSAGTAKRAALIRAYWVSSTATSEGAGLEIALMRAGAAAPTKAGNAAQLRITQDGPVFLLGTEKRYWCGGHGFLEGSSGEELQLYAGGFQLYVSAPASGETGLKLNRNIGGTQSVARVLIGPDLSGPGGVGRALYTAA